MIALLIANSNWDLSDHFYGLSLAKLGFFMTGMFLIKTTAISCIKIDLFSYSSDSDSLTLLVKTNFTSSGTDFAPIFFITLAL